MYEVFLFGDMKKALGSSITLQATETTMTGATFRQKLEQQYPSLSQFSYSLVANERRIGNNDAFKQGEEIVLIPKV